MPSKKAKEEHPKCPACGSKDTVRKGMRKCRMRSAQKYMCRSCGRSFTRRGLMHKTYPPKIVLGSLSLYNLGYSQRQVSEILTRRHGVRVPPRNVSEWVRQYSDICTFARLRKQASRLFGPRDMILRERLEHKQVYRFRLHRAKLAILEKSGALPGGKFQCLHSYFDRITGAGEGRPFPHHIFTIPPESPDEEKRASSLGMSLLELTRLEKRNHANRLAGLALELSPNNYARHDTIQDFMITNDSSTIAAEVPVYLTGDDIRYFRDKGFTLDFKGCRTPITGHIDFVQVRRGLVHVLDYKPDAGKVNAVEQLTIYALALASRTKLAVKDFKCAWFDDRDYYEFFPLHAVYPRKSS
jgi:predicted RNA-binding Zn-ribbon protein involved in translation (DUF1610 family)